MQTITVDVDDDSLSDENTDTLNDMASPITTRLAPHHPEPSPRLPPPASASSRLTLSNGEEFMNLRRGLATDLKSPAEYTLHIVFTQFVRHAERKLNLCLEYSVHDEAQVIELLAEGNGDDQFDKIIASLGYIAKKKPKPIIDSVMFWRKSKSEVASLAATEVEKVLVNAKSNLGGNGSNSIPNPSPINTNGPKSKRSLSLMRSKSISRIRDHRRNQSASTAAVNKSPVDTTAPSQPVGHSEYAKQKAFYDEQFNQARETAVQAERKSLASIYILCRVLIEVVKQTSPEVMGDDLGVKLEEIVYTQLKTTDPISTSESLLRSANWNLFAELLGCMSEKRFLSVSDRFIADLEKIPTHISHDDEPRLHLLIHGMRYLKLTNYPLEVFEESAEFIESLAKFFKNVQNESLILAYCEVLSNLLLPLANILTAETNHPTWCGAIERIFSKAYFIWNKSNSLSFNSEKGSSGFINLSPNNSSHNGSVANQAASNVWECSLSLLTACLSVSRKELFQTSWYEIIEENMNKLKPKVDIEERTTFIACIDRLLWVFLFRLSDTLNNTIKRLDNLFQLLFFNSAAINKKNQWITADVYLINALVQLIRIVGYRHLNFTLDNIIIELVKQSFNGSTLENLQPEKLILSVKSYMAILADYEIGKRPVFPTDETLKSNNYKDNEKIDFNFIAKNSDNALSHEEIIKNFANLIKLLDTSYGCSIWNKDSSVSPGGNNQPKVQSPFSAFHFGIDFSYQTTKNLHLELFATLIEAAPWTMVPLSSGITFKGIVEILARNSVHSNFRIANASINALRRLASRKNPSSLLNYFAKFAFQFSDKPNPNYDTAYLNSEEFHRLLKLYVELLNCWLRQFKQSSESKQSGNFAHPLSQDDELMSKDVLNDMYQINYKTDDLGVTQSKPKASDELEWKTIITVIEEIEGNGLFFLCSQDHKVRYYGISILKLVDQFDQEIYNATDNTNNPTEANGSTGSAGNGHTQDHSRTSSKFAADFGTRLIHVFEKTDFLDLIKPLKPELSLPERNRVSKLKHKSSILIRLAESDYGIDSTLWFRLYPKLLDIFFEKCPLPVAFCRSIVCVRLVQMHEQILEFSDSYKNYTSSIFSRTNNGVAPEVLVDQWRLYLIFACCSLTSTNEQKISFPSQPTHGRKRSLQMFIQHQKITSAKSVFRMVVPLLKSQQPMVKDSVISSLSCININIFKTLLESVQSPLGEWETNAKRKDPGEDRLRIEIIHILSRVTTRFGPHNLIYSDEWIIANLVSVVKSVKNFLSAGHIQIDIDFQKLRRYFCIFLEKIFIGLEKKSDLDRWLPFEARIGCFNYLKEWCGYGESKDITEERYNLMLEKCNQSKNLPSAAAILEVERKQLSVAALNCMATILSGNITQQIDIPGNVALMSFDVPSLMKWIYSLLSNESESVHDIGKKALSNILRMNPDNDEIYQEVLKQCYTSQDNAKTTESYYITFVHFLMERKQFSKTPSDLLCLATFLIGDDNCEIRKYSMKLLRFVESKFFNSTTVNRFSEAVTSKNKVVYKKALFEISVHLASILPEHNFEQISYFTMCFNVVGNDTRRDILSCLLPWVQTVEVAYNVIPNEVDKLDSDTRLVKPINDLTPASIMVLNNLFEITVKFSSLIMNEVEALWVALGTKPGNFDIIVDYLVSNSLERKSVGFVGYARRIIDYLSYSQPDINIMVDKLIGNLQPKNMVPPRPHSIIDSVRPKKEFPYIANLWELIPYNDKDAAFSLGQLSLIFLVDLFTSDNERMVSQLPLLLHISFSLLDHYLPPVQEAAASLLRHLLHCLALTDPKTEIALNKLGNSDHTKFLWVYDDLNNDKKGARTPKNMDLLVRNCLEIVTPIVANLQEEWSRVALSWATTCAVRHIACRSFQVFRSLLSFLDQPMLKDMLHRLSNTISDETPDIQGFAMQILMTLNAINAELDSEKLIDFPQLFWSGVACLSTIHEQEFIEVLSAMTKFVSKIDLDSPETVSCLISTFPPKWEGRFEGLQQVVMVGLRSATAYDQTMRFLDKLNTLQDSEIIGQGDGRLLMTIVANLPRFLHSLDSKTANPEVETAALVLSGMSERNQKPSLAKIFVSLAKNRFRSKKDFLVQTISSIKAVFFPEYEPQTLVLLLGLLSNKTSWIKLETLSILKYVMPMVELSRDEFVGVGADLISPLLRLLLTDYAEPALEVLDEAVSISGSQLDRDVLRMSLGNSSMKKEYEKTATLFGIPDDSGWAIPMPSVTAASTRNNVHAVFSTCTATSLITEIPQDEEIQFHREDYYAPPTDTASAVDERTEQASLSHMWAALDDFDSFFTKEHDSIPIISPGPRRGDITPAAHLNHLRGGPATHLQHHTHSASIDTGVSTASDSLAPLDSAPFVYDKKASVILNRSLARTRSNASFKTSLADSITPYPRPPTSPLGPKRSYIPFRNSKHQFRSRDTFTTPVMPTSPTFEAVGSPGTITSEVTGDEMMGDTPTMLDTILGSNKKRVRRHGRQSAIPLPEIDSPDSRKRH
ncbi:transcriptional activator leucine zipper [Yamadazyma tenuis ATCC 10573]|uniref:Transcriptional activator leucine zipper n=2 Tax=Candida tenuis TaxID=2315449 RepID=G3B6Y5_CANTC|nr:transcriptional activator leucine zipper [Yamadazyma tenuis ATCC 10573]EGV63049.1 transcriptional activator leucine zipper [Yamadazyma tenuis ATCC 10573]